jgi:deoxyadenosine/deoxycytidine kinase
VERRDGIGRRIDGAEGDFKRSARIATQARKRTRALRAGETRAAVIGWARLARGKFIAIAGNIGAGKTELTGFLCKKYGLKPFFEPNDENPYLANFYQDMKTWAFRSQIFFLTHKFRLHRELEREPGTALQDRTIYEDAEIFAKNLYRQRYIDKRDFKTYWELYETIAQSLAPPDLMIYCRAPVKTLKERIKLRGRAMEKDIPTAYLTRLHGLYEEWFEGYKMSPVLVLPTDKLDYLTNLVDRVDLFRKIEKYL